MLTYWARRQVGFDSRIDYQDRIKQKKEKSLEVIWRVNADSPVVQDNVDLFDYNVQERVNDFVAAAIAQANHIMWTVGTDFKYQYAHTCYADRVNAYWTGYFTSRPALKFYVRKMSGYYLAASQLEFFKGRSDSRPNTDSLADSLAIAQHHDAVAGTEKQQVANDYAKRQSIGYTEAEKVVASSLACLTDSKSSIGCGDSTSNFQQCPLLNITYCPASETDLSHGKNLIVVTYNSLGWKREDVIRFPVVNEDVVVRDSEGRKMESQLLPIVDAYVDLRNYYARAYLGSNPEVEPKFLLAFTASVPPLGFSTYIISTSKMPGARSTRSSMYKFQMGGNQLLKLVKEI
ncbi:Glycosyl hydrolase family 38 protein [Hibiscus syriacus]|uniref:Glycosyl hydrolase family 38 protein n=1 Tax=Hibiscus syriacus TaxID=106335 RepID=A0A6A2ZWP1_HIBSY|nr:Glycosyl hydrolase family 38 protein [Hibiscus syriacus]